MRGVSAEITIYIGGLHISREPALIKTVLGSCIAVCLHDPEAHVGGMNHFMLPAPSEQRQVAQPSRFGVHAMELLIGGLQRLGGDRRRLRAKLFGGGHVLGTAESERSVPRRNIDFILRYMEIEGIPVVSQDLGGYQARRVHYYTESGKVFVKRLGQAAIQHVSQPERAAARRPETGAYGPVILFEEGKR
jgi:chemotaxis protein CheD